MGNESSGSYQLSILLRASDQMSAVLGKSVGNLKKFRTEVRGAVKDYEALRKSLAKPLPTVNINKQAAQERNVAREVSRLHKQQQDARHRIADQETRLQEKRANDQVRREQKAAREQVKLSQQVAREQDKAARDVARIREQTAKQAATQEALRSRAQTALAAVEARQTRNAQRNSANAFLRQMKVTDDQMRDQQRARHGRGFSGRMEQLDSLYQGGRQIAGIWREQADSLRPYVDAALRLSQAQQKFMALNLGDSDNARAFAAVKKTVSQVKGVSLAETQETLTDLHSALGNLDHAIEALPLASKYRFSFETLYGDKFSSEQIESNIQSSFKFLEMIGAMRATGAPDARGKRAYTDEDRTRAEAYFNRSTQITAAMGGRVTPAEMLAMAKTGGVALQGLTLEGLTHLTGPIQEMSGGRVGTSLQSIYGAVIGGQMKQTAMEEWQRLNLIDPGKVKFNKSGIPKTFMPGAVPIGDLLQKDPLQFADELKKAMQSHGINTSDTNAVNKELAVLLQNRTGRELASLLINQHDRIVKDTGIVENTKGIEALNKQALDSPMGRYIQYQKAMENFRAEIGQGLLPMLTKMAEVVTPIARFFAEHEEVAKYAVALLLVSKVGGGLVQTFSAMNSIRSMFGGMGNIEREAEEAAGAISKTERAALGLSRAPKDFSFMIRIGIYGLAIAEVLEFIKVAREAHAAQEAAAKAADDYTRAEQKAIKSGAITPTPKYELGQAGTLYGILNRQLTFGSAASAIIQGYLHGDKAEQEALSHQLDAALKTGTTYSFFSGNLRQMKELGRPERMAAFRALTMTREGVTPEMYQGFERAMATIAPEVFRASGKFLPQMLVEATKNKKPEQLSLLSSLLGMDVSSYRPAGLPPRSLPEAQQLSSAEQDRFFRPAPPGTTPHIEDSRGWLSRMMGNVQIPPVKDVADALRQPVQPAKDLAPALQQDVTAARNFATEIGNIKLSTQVIATLNGTPNPTNMWDSLFGRKPKSVITLPSKASGGHVLRGGLVRVHDDEAIVPARVTRAWREAPPDVRSLSGTMGSGISYGDFHFTFNVPHGSAAANDPKAFAEEVRAVVKDVLDESLAGRLHDHEDELDRIMARMVGRYRERA